MAMGSDESSLGGDKTDSGHLTGAANIAEKNTAGPRTDKEYVPEEAMRPPMENQDHHVGRGGAGNVHEHHNKKAEDGEKPKGLVDKLRAKIKGMLKK